MIRTIACDTETGGIYGDYSLLTAYFEVLDEQFNVLDSLDLAIKPQDDMYHVTAEALAVNKINLIEHDKTAVPKSLAGQQLRNFLIKNSEMGKIKLVPLGHNVSYDLQTIYRELLNKREAERYLSYGSEDTGVLGRTLKRLGLIPEQLSTSLSSYAKFYGIEVTAAHTASGDTKTTVAVFKAMLQQIKNLNPMAAHAHQIQEY